MKWMQVLSERQGHRFNALLGRSLFYGGLLLLGVFVGVQLYCHAEGAQATALKQLLAIEAVTPSWRAGMGGLWQTLVLPMLLLVIAYVSGISPCGVLTALLLPVAYGMGVGAAQAHLYADGVRGVVVTVLLIVPRVWIMWLALQRACDECMRMSRLILAQLRPAGAHCGGLQVEFRQYCIRFLAAVLLIFGAGLWDVLWRMILSGWLI